MEVVGAVASFIAIGQALTAGRHVIDVLRAIPGIGDELIWLNNEIETLRLVVEEADMRGTSTDQSLPETPLLKRARLQLSEIAADLEEVYKDCVRAVTEDGKVKAKKRKWLWQRTKLSDCREKARDARANLLAALQTLQLKETKETKQLVLRIESFAIETHGAMALMSSDSKVLQTSPHRLQKPQVYDMKEIHRPPYEKSVGQLTTDIDQFAFSGDRSKRTSKLSPRGTDSVIINASLSTFERCPRPCWCRCHGSRPVSYRSADWARNLIGSFSLACDRKVTCHNGVECDTNTCKGSRKVSADFSYCFPAWLCSRLISLQVSLNASTGISFSLRPVRILPLHDRFWGCVTTWSRIELNQLMQHEGIIYPGDSATDGETALSYVVRKGTADVVTYLAGFWRDQLNSGSFDDCWFFDANRFIEDYSSMSSEERNAMSSMVSCNEARIDAIQTPLHSAVKQANLADVQQAAKDQPWAMGQFNHRGETPLHIAARLGNLDAVRELLKLGCNVDYRDSSGDTVLIIACAEGYAFMTQYLLDAGCNVGAKNNLGITALHRAAAATGESSMKIISSLLSAGALTTAITKDGRSVLHYFLDNNPDKHIMVTNLRMLLDAGADLEARDHTGNTPLDEAIIYNRQICLQCLVEAGARTAASGFRGNILHHAALFADHNVLSYLESLSLSRINTHMVDRQGDTAWDNFTFVSYYEDWRLSSCRRPTAEEAQAFVRLYQGVRDRNLDLDMKILQRIRQYLLHEDPRGAAAALGPLVKQKEEWERWDLVETYKTIGLQIREAMWDAAIESVDENLEVLQEEMAKSPWENPSRWDWLRYDDSDETASESEDESETVSVHSDEGKEQLSTVDEETNG